MRDATKLRGAAAHLTPYPLMNAALDDTQSLIPCNLCGGHAVSVLSRRSRSGAALRTVACKACGLAWSDPRPHEARSFYTDDYRVAYKGSFTPRPKHVLRAGRVALDRLAKIRPWLAGRPRVLDVGSGGGEFAYLLQRLGHVITGIEPNNGYGRYAAETYGLDIRLGFLADRLAPGEQFDLITIWHVLEHTEDPGATLRLLAGALRPGGRLVVEVPNVEAICQSPRSSFHEAHLYSFNAASLGCLARRNGLSICDTRLSADGGNLTMVLAPADAADPMPAATIEGNHARVAGVVAGHTPLAHALSSHPWRRAGSRLAGAVSEWVELRPGENGRALLDRLYGPELGEAVPARPALPVATWASLAAAYLAAVFVEEWFVDHWAAANGWSSGATLGVYLALQMAVIAGVIALARSRRLARRELLRVGGWAAPLLAIPAVC